MKKITTQIIFTVCLLIGLNSNAQFTESFETEIPATWTIINNGSLNGWVHNSAPDGGAQDGTGVASILYNSNSHDDYLITPAINVTAGVNDYFTYYVKSRSATFLEPYAVLLSTTGTDSSDFTVTLKATSLAPNGWQLDEFSLAAYIGQTVYIAIYATGTDEFELFVDNVVNTGLPNCLAPSSMSATNLSSDTADLSWTAGDAETSWDIEWKAGADFTPGVGEDDAADVVSDSPEYGATGLAPNETYYVYYRADCGGGDISDWVGPFLFTTYGDCSSTGTFAYLNNSTLTSSLNSFVANNSGDFITLTFTAGSTETCCDTWFINDAADGSGSTIASGNGSIVGSYESTTGEISFYVISDFSTTGTTFEFSLSCAAPPACLRPTNPTASVLTSETASLSWVPGDTETLWDIELVDLTAGGSATGAPTATGVTNPYVATGLIEGNDYEYYVRADCDGSVSDWTGPLAWTQNVPPANDECENAVALTVNSDLDCGVITAGTTEFATASANPTTGLSGTANNDIWYSFTATGPAHRISLINLVYLSGGTFSSTDMGMGLYNAAGGCEGMTFIGTSDPETWNVTGLTSGDTYYVRVYGWSSTLFNINFDICVGTPPPPPTNDDCAGALVLNESTIGTCDNAVSGTTVSATPSSEADCSTTNADVWYTFVPSETNTYNISVTETQDFGFSSTYVSVFEGSCGNITQVGTACFSSSGSFALTAGNTYYVNVRSTSTTAGVNFSLCAALPPPPPANDACEDATVVGSLPYNISQDASAATNNDGFISACTGGMNDGVWYTFTVETAGTINISISDVIGWDPEIAIYSGACGAFTCVARADNGGGGAGESISTAVTAGTQYWLNIGHWSGSTNNSEGPFTLDISSSNVTLDVEGFEVNSAFTFYPNPVKNTLTLTAQNNIEQVTVFNMLGQAVLKLAPNTTTSEVDMTTLGSGTYFAQITINDIVKTVKVVKQ